MAPAPEKMPSEMKKTKKTKENSVHHNQSNKSEDFEQQEHEMNMMALESTKSTISQRKVEKPPLPVKTSYPESLSGSPLKKKLTALYADSMSGDGGDPARSHRSGGKSSARLSDTRRSLTDVRLQQM